MSGYRVVGTLGKGARSVILEVVQELTGKKFALKCVTRRDANDDRFIEQV